MNSSLGTAGKKRETVRKPFNFSRRHGGSYSTLVVYFVVCAQREVTRYPYYASVLIFISKNTQIFKLLSQPLRIEFAIFLAPFLR